MENNKQVASSKNHAQAQIREHKPYPISDQNDSKTIPFGTTHTHIAYMGGGEGGVNVA